MTLLKAIFCKFIGNFGIVHSGVVYRSGQAFILYPIWFVMWTTEFFGGAGLKSILNLSHKPEKDNWATHMIPANGWIEFLIARWEAK